MIIPKTREEIELMRESALLVSRTLGEIAKEIKPGVTTLYLDKLADFELNNPQAHDSYSSLFFSEKLLKSLRVPVLHSFGFKTDMTDQQIKNQLSIFLLNNIETFFS